MQDVVEGTLEQVDLLAGIAADGFYDDPVLRWVLPDPATRAQHLRVAFAGLLQDYLPDRGVVHVVGEASVALWRSPEFDHASRDDTSDGEQGAGGQSPFPDDVVERFGILRSVMAEAHPHEPHWYLNVLSTRPQRQGQGLGARVLQPVLARCDAEGVASYLESSNPRNMTLYRRQGYEQIGELPLPDGPSLYPMWRNPR